MLKSKLFVYVDSVIQVAHNVAVDIYPYLVFGDPNINKGIELSFVPSDGYVDIYYNNQVTHIQPNTERNPQGLYIFEHPLVISRDTFKIRWFNLSGVRMSVIAAFALNDTVVTVDRPLTTLPNIDNGLLMVSLSIVISLSMIMLILFVRNK